MTIGRPKAVTPRIADEICERLADGETLKRICADDHMPARSSVSLHVVNNVVFSDRVARAREAGSHVIVDEARDIADDGTNDWMEKKNREGEVIGWALNGEHVQRSKLRIETRYREAEAILPKVYAKRSMIEHSGGIHVSTADDETLIMELLAMAETGRLKLPNGIQLVEPDTEDDEDDMAGPIDDYEDMA